MKKIILLLTAFLLFASAAFAQGSIEGTITDAKGKGVANVSVTVVGANGKAVATATTDGEGAYTFDEIAAGKYKVVANGAKGYMSAFRDDVVVTAADPITLNITLTAAAESPVPKPTVEPVIAPVQPATSVITLDEIINRHINALGGREKLLSLKAVRMKGSIDYQGADAAVTINKSHLVGFRSSTIILSLESAQWVTPSYGFNINPMDNGVAVAIPANELPSVQYVLDAQGSLLDHKAKGTVVQLLGNEKVDGDDNFKLQLTFKSGYVITYFIDAKTFLLTKTLEQKLMNGTPTQVSTTYSNYKKNADGYIFAYTEAVEIGQLKYELNFNTIETNISIDPALFAAPR